VGKAFLRAQAYAQATECLRMALELEPQHARAKQLFLEVLAKAPSQPGHAEEVGLAGGAGPVRQGRAPAPPSGGLVV
jgi:hypothetical protein